jgi:hypothetical protein
MPGPAFPTLIDAVALSKVQSGQYNVLIDALETLHLGVAKGDLIYFYGSGTYERLPFSENGVLVADPATGVPLWLPKPSVASILEHDGADTFSWLPLASISGLHQIGFVNWLANDQTENAGTWTNATNATLDLVTTQTCTIMMIAIAQTYVSNASWGVQLRCSIDGTVDPSATLPWASVANVNVTQTAFYMRKTVAAGTKSCKLQFRVTSGGATAHIDRGSILALAFAEN